MSKEPIQPQDKYVLRLPDGMRDRIARVAKQNGRSMNAEMVQRLSESLDHDDWMEEMARQHREHENSFAGAYDEYQSSQASGATAYSQMQRPDDMPSEELELLMKTALEASHAAAMETVRRLLVARGGRVIRFDEKGNKLGPDDE